MNSEIEIDGEWQKCEFLYPLKEFSIEAPGPLGSANWQKPRHNAKLISKTIYPGEYNIRHNGRQLVFEADRPDINGTLGNVL